MATSGALDRRDDVQNQADVHVIQLYDAPKRGPFAATSRYHYIDAFEGALRTKGVKRLPKSERYQKVLGAPCLFFVLPTPLADVAKRGLRRRANNKRNYGRRRKRTSSTSEGLR